MRQEMTHFDEEGNARMVDVSDKDVTKRIAVAEGCIRMSEEAFQAVTEHRIAKGDVLTVAQVAGISGTKKTSELIPMCHLLALTGAGITFGLSDQGAVHGQDHRTHGRGNGSADRRQHSASDDL